ncbi:acyl-CoA thioesterase [Paenibacillus donghaensis]|uniref:Thioesterase n=1 Tax=Paenibacillus donghaensis TaxID=414771 RepID=A0A2Z2KH75_9BACL|nr:thioesterase family protein [Paenibacillus donghaensis]ASA20192.1 hypothetical protein B9T62_04885 [Paenibacillus donghaensis]
MVSPAEHSRIRLPYSCIIVPRFQDTDAYGVMHHSSYYVWFEEARFQFAREILQFQDPLLQGEEVRFPVIESCCRYKSPVRYGDSIKLGLVFELGSAARIKFEYKAFNEQSGKICAEGYTVHVFSDRENRILLNIPEWLQQRAEAALQV